MVIKNCRRKKITIGAPNIPGIIRGFQLSTQPKFLNMIKAGIIVTVPGIMIVPSRTVNNLSRPRNVCFAKP
ncbi:hypothetical protein D3C73_1521730 [compost metagenome]